MKTMHGKSGWEMKLLANFSNSFILKQKLLQADSLSTGICEESLFFEKGKKQEQKQKKISKLVVP